MVIGLFKIIESKSRLSISQFSGSHRIIFILDHLVCSKYPCDSKYNYDNTYNYCCRQISQE